MYLDGRACRSEPTARGQRTPSQKPCDTHKGAPPPPPRKSRRDTHLGDGFVSFRFYFSRFVDTKSTSTFPRSSWLERETAFAASCRAPLSLFSSLLFAPPKPPRSGAHMTVMHEEEEGTAAGNTELQPHRVVAGPASSGFVRKQLGVCCEIF